MDLGRSAIGDQLTTFTEIKSSPGRWKAALRATIMTAITVVVVGLIFGKSLALLGITGSFIGNSVPNRPWRSRLQILAWMDAVYLVGCGLAVLVGNEPVLLSLLLTTIAIVTVLGYNAVVADPPGPIFLIIGPAIASYLSTRGVARWDVLGVSALGCIVGCTISLLLHPRTKETAEEKAVETAAEKVKELDRIYADDHSPLIDRATQRDAAYAAVLSASMTLENAAGRNPRRREWRSLLLELRRLHFSIISRIASDSMPGAVVEVESMAQRRYLGTPPVSYLVRWGLSPRSLPWLAARRIGIAIALTCITSYGLRLHHPFWAVMTTALVMSMGADRLSLTHRALHRMIGTLAGVVAFAGLHALDPSLNAVFVIAIALVFMVQWTVVRNYALGAFFVTPMALLVTSSNGSALSLGQLVQERVVDTLIGVAVSVIVMWVTDRRAPIALVRRQFRRTLRANARVLELIARDEHTGPEGFRARRDLAYEQLQAGHILRIAQQDKNRLLGNWSAVEAVVNAMSYTVLAACWIRNPNKHVNAAAMATALRGLITDLPPVSTSLVDASQLAADLEQVLIVGVPRIPLPPLEPDPLIERAPATD
ncbi:FUSC family protein [Calidifontibacter terrae]